jgi:hypothetical protein
MAEERETTKGGRGTPRGAGEGDSGSGPAGTSSSPRLGVLWRWREEYNAGVAACVAAWLAAAGDPG